MEKSVALLLYLLVYNTSSFLFIVGTVPLSIISGVAFVLYRCIFSVIFL